MSLAAAELRIEPDDGIQLAAVTGKPSAHRLQDRAKTAGRKRVSKERLGVAVLGGRLATHDLRKVGGELLVLEAALKHVQTRRAKVEDRFHPYLPTRPD